MYLVGVNYNILGWDPRTCDLDASTWQPLPQKDAHIPWRYLPLKLKLLLSRGKPNLTVYDYAEVLDRLLRKSAPEFVDYPTVLPNWDNTPRSGMNGLVLHGSTPDLFRILLRRALAMVESRDPDHRIIFVKAWNEWAEGNHLEPDQRFGRGYLEAIQEELTESRFHVRH